MKRFIFAAVAAMFVLAPVHAADPKASTTTTDTMQTQTTQTVKNPMSPEDCKTAMDKCGADEECKAKLVMQGCAPAVPMN